MKRMISLALSLVVVAFTSCDTNNTQSNQSQIPESSAIMSAIENEPESSEENDLAASAEKNTSTEETSSEPKGEESMQTTPSSQNTSIKLTVGDTVITADLYDSEISRQFANILPQTITMTRGRDREYYGRIDDTLQYDEADIQTTAEDGDLAYWFSGNSLAFFFNTENDAAVNSGIVVFGKITSDLSVFNDMGSSETMTVTLTE